MKKIILMLFAIPLLMGAACSQNKSIPSTDDSTIEEKIITEEEEAFNNSGQAKAVEDESDLWPFYNNPELGISFNYPPEVILLQDGTFMDNPEQTYLDIEIKEIGIKEAPMDFDKEGAMANIEALTSGQFGIAHNFPFQPSQQVKTVGCLFAQDFITLARFEICSVTLE